MELTKEVLALLSAPFDPKEISWRPGAITKDRKRAMALAYIEARAVMQRLDDVVPGEWSFLWEPVPWQKVVPPDKDNGETEDKVVPAMGVKGTLAVCDVSRQDVGEGGESEMGSTLKAMVSDTLKRCGVQFGIGRYLYSLPQIWVDWDDASRHFKTEPTLPAWALPKAGGVTGYTGATGLTGWNTWPEEKHKGFRVLSDKLQLDEGAICAEFGVDCMPEYEGTIEDARVILDILGAGINEYKIGVAGIHSALKVRHTCDWTGSVEEAEERMKG